MIRVQWSTGTYMVQKGKKKNQGKEKRRKRGVKQTKIHMCVSPSSGWYWDGSPGAMDADSWIRREKPGNHPLSLKNKEK